MSTSVPPAGNHFNPARRKKRKGAAQRVSFFDRLQNVTLDIFDTEWISGCQKQIEVILGELGWYLPDVLCLGLGSPTESANAAAQLAFVISICDYLKIPRDQVSFFDPHFTQEDIDGLLQLKFRVLSENKRGKHALERRTLLVMPHCGAELYENLLQANFGPEDLQHLLLLGNVLEDYAIATPAAKLEREFPCISRIWNHLACDRISPFEPFPSAFNNMGIQYVLTDSLPRLGDAVWTLPLPYMEDKMPSAEVL